MTVEEFNVSLYTNFVFLFIPLYARYMCEYNGLNSIYSAERSNDFNSTTSSSSLYEANSCLYISHKIALVQVQIDYTNQSRRSLCLIKYNILFHSLNYSEICREAVLFVQ